MKAFLPYEEIRDRDVIMVDGNYARGIVLSHWKGSGSPPEAADDTSAGIVLNALKLNLPLLASIPYVTANHFDIDGFIGVWSVLNKEKALANESLLKHIAYIGDFREIDFTEEGWEKAVKMCCWINKVEKEKFYPPFGMWETEEAEFKACAAKFRFFLEAFEDVLENTESYKNDWAEEYEKVLAGIEVLRKAETAEYPGTGLKVIKATEAVHYYALFSITRGFDMALCIYPGNRYELEYKYTTWVDIISRPVLPRVDMKQLLGILNREEKSDMKWYGSKITDTGPIMRLDTKQLSYMELFKNPYEREIYSSRIEEERFIDIVTGYYRRVYEGVTPKAAWTWKEIREINNNSKIHNFIDA